MASGKILYADGWLLAVDKPTGLLAVPGRGPAKRDALIVRLQRRWPTARVVHRLDRDTSGLMLVALDAAVHRALSARFARRQVDKRYVAEVEGVVDRDAGRIDLPLRKDLQRKYRHVVDMAHGKAAATEYRVVARTAFSSRLVLRPITGRSHQLRVHLAAIGHPIVGDPLYGHAPDRPDPPPPPPETPPPESLPPPPEVPPPETALLESLHPPAPEFPEHLERQPSVNGVHQGPPAAERLRLHASGLAVEHPVTGAWLSLLSPPPF